MKTLILLIAAAILGAVAASVVVSQRAAHHRARELARAQSRWEVERATLEAQATRGLPFDAASRFADTRDRVSPNATNAPATTPAPASPRAPGAPDPTALLAHLAGLPLPAGPAHPRIARRILHDLEELADAGPAAVEPIHRFLLLHQDVDYRPANLPGGGNPASRVSPPKSAPAPGPETVEAGSERNPLPAFPLPLPPTPPVEFLLPPTLRIGLFDVLRSIGGDPAERVLVETLTTTGKGLEVAWLTRVLDDPTPGKYRDFALTAARELLSDPPEDLRAGEGEPELYYVLHRFRDPVFVATARDLLVDDRGVVNRWALGYFTEMRGEEALPAIAAAWRRGPPTPEGRSLLVAAALPFVGRNREADDLFRDFTRQAGIDLTLRLAAVHAVGFGPATSARTTSTAGTEADAAVGSKATANRLALLELLAAEAGTAEPGLGRGLDRAIDNLRRVTRGEPPLPLSWTDFARNARPDREPSNPRL
jgi:hypothetical protein